MDGELRPTSAMSLELLRAAAHRMEQVNDEQARNGGTDLISPIPCLEQQNELAEHQTQLPAQYEHKLIGAPLREL